MKYCFDEIKINHKLLVHSGTLELNEPGIVVIEGANGCGKTLFLNKMFNNYKDRSVFIRQSNTQIFRELSVKENILLCDSTEKAQRLETYIRKYNLAYLLELHASRLSGGEKRLISILRGICSGKPMIFMDEPTNDLSYENVAELLRILKDISSFTQVILVTHDDRIKKIANARFQIEDRTLKSMDSLEKKQDNTLPETDVLESASESGELKSFDRIFSIRGIRIVLFLLMLISLICGSYTFCTVSDNSMEIKYRLSNNQINLFYGKSLSGNEMSVFGAFPMDIVAGVFSGDLEPKDLRMKERQGGFGKIGALDAIPESDLFDVINWEYYDKDKKQYYDLTDYIEEGEQNEYCFVSPDDFANCGTTSISKSKYVKAEQELKKNIPAIHTGFAIVLLKNGKNLSDFMNDKRIRSLDMDDIYLQSNDTIRMQNELYAMNSMKMLSDRMVLIVCMCFALMSIVFAIYIYLKRTYIKNLICYGMSEKHLYQLICKRMLPAHFLLEMLACIGMSDVFLWVLIHDISDKILSLGFVNVILGLFYLVSLLFLRCIVKFVLHDLGSWKSRV